MMNWISLILQLVTLRKGLQESQSMLDSAKHFAEKGKRTLAAFLSHTLAALFFFSALLVAVIDIGLQIDRGAGVGFHGLMVSATILVVIGLIFVCTGLLLGRAPAPVEHVEPVNPRADRIKDLLEDVVVSFLKNLSKPDSSSSRSSKSSKSSKEDPNQD